jgi:hypothetical protein
VLICLLVDATYDKRRKGYAGEEIEDDHLQQHRHTHWSVDFGSSVLVRIKNQSVNISAQSLFRAFENIHKLPNHLDQGRKWIYLITRCQMRIGHFFLQHPNLCLIGKS